MAIPMASSYGTRRKSVNLSLLGISLPRPSQQSPPTSTTQSTSSSTDEQSSPPTKRIKTSHGDAPTSEPLCIPSLPLLKPQEIKLPLATPPSPPPEDVDAAISQYPKVDTEGINDDVVIATIKQLEKTDNRPHLLKELAIAIAGHVHVVETSANQSAIISSRLTNFLKRPWSNLGACPLGKDLIGTHPKRLYFYLSGRPHLPFPDPEPRSSAASRSIISPSLTSAATDEAEEDLTRRRVEMSPSPALELEEPALDFDEPSISSLSRSTSFPSSHLSSGIATPGLAQSRSSPALERDEHEFTQTANALQLLRRESEMKANVVIPEVKLELPSGIHMLGEDPCEESAALRILDEADTVFGQTDAFFMRKSSYLMSSPMMIPQKEMDGLGGKPIPFAPTLAPIADKFDTGFAWAELKSPETVELAELENLFESY